MTTLGRLRVSWTGFTGAPGLSTFYAEDTGSGFCAAVLNFFTQIRGVLPNVVTITVPSEGDLINDASGALVGAWSDTGGGTTTGNGGTTYAGPVGAVVHWNTGAIINSRRLRGSTFIVPVASGFDDTDGTVSSGGLSTLRTQASNLVGAVATLRAWHRPGNTSGSSALITSASVPDKMVVLRSRRD